MSAEAPILTATRWPSNAELIADVAKLGYLDGKVLDTTYKNGVFWKCHRPDALVTNDLNPKVDSLWHYDFRFLPFRDRGFDAVVFDPPYKLNGTPTQDTSVDERYGVSEPPTRWQDRIQLMLAGMAECCRVSRRTVLAKCMDQVCSGKKVWQTLLLTEVAEACGFRLQDRFDILGTPRPQRSQVHSHGNYSTLLVFTIGKQVRPATPGESREVAP